MRRREASINDVAIQVAERKFHWPAPGPTDELGSHCSMKTATLSFSKRSPA